MLTSEKQKKQQTNGNNQDYKYKKKNVNNQTCKFKKRDFDACKNKNNLKR